MSNWREAQEGEWVITDDLQVCKILRRSSMKTSSGKTMDYVRTILGTFTTNPNVDMGGIPPKNIYSFSEEIEVILSDIGASKEYLLEMTKNIIDNIDGKDGDKLRAIELMMKIAGMFPNDKKTESLTVFQGFSEDQLKRISSDNVKVIGHAEKTINDKTDPS